MKTLVYISFLLFLVACKSPQLNYVADGYAKTSVNTAVFRTNSIVSHGENQYISFYDKDGYVTVGKRSRKNNDWEIQRTQYKGHVEDAHNVISMMIDGDGFIHLSFDHHGHPLKYCKSTSPETLTFGELEFMLSDDENNVTYPEFYRLANGNLIFVYRSGSSGRGNLVLNLYDLASKKWKRIQNILIDGEDKRNAYWQLTVDNEGVIHLSWVWRETWLVETNHDLCYAKSKDGGLTWEKTTGEKYTLPINKDNAEYACIIPQNSELINQTGMSTDEHGNPYIATYWRDQNSMVPQYRLVYHDGSTWHSQQVSERTTPFSLSGGGTKMIPIARPRLVIDTQKENIKAWYIYRDIERGSKLSIAYSGNIKDGKWKTIDYTDFSLDAWEPTYDTELWRAEKKLHLYVQNSQQGDGEKSIEIDSQPIYVLEINK